MKLGLGFWGSCCVLLSVVGCGDDKPRPGDCDDCAASGSSGSAGVPATAGGGAGATSPSAGSAGSGATSSGGASGSAAGGAKPSGGSAGQAAICKGTPSADCSSPGCDKMPGCTAVQTSSCSGSATPCSAFDGTAAECGAQAGCGTKPNAGVCVQAYDSCSPHGHEYNTCNGLSGCTYNGIESTCTGTVIDCTKIGSAAPCDAELACTWIPADQEYCLGVSAACDDLSGARCEGQDGCSLSPGECTGTPQPCAELSKEACGQQPGCVLSAGGSGPSVAQLPDLTLRALILDVVKNEQGNDVFDFGYDEINRGNVASTPHENHVVVSEDDVLGNEDDVLIHVQTVVEILPYGTAFVQSAEGHYSMTPFTDAVKSGYYYIGFLLDGKGAVSESEEGNNSFLSKRVFIGTPSVDLAAQALSSTAVSPLAPGDAFDVSVTVKSSSNVNVSSVPVTVYLSKDTTVDGGDTVVGSLTMAVDLAPGAETVVKVACNAPRLRGSYYLVAKVDPANSLQDADPSNNQIAAGAPLEINAPSPDLLLEAVAVDSADVAWKGSVTFSATVKNAGSDPASASKVAFYLSKDALLDANDTKICEALVGAVAANASSDVSQSCPLPGTIMGTQRALAVADSADAVFETDETNNFRAGTTTLSVGNPSWDLSLGDVADNAGTTLKAGKTVSYQVAVVNGGSDPIPEFAIRVYLSADQIITSGDTAVCTETVAGIAGLGNKTFNFSCELPTLTVGSYYYTGIALDPENLIVETIETNNRVASSSSRQAVTP